MAGFGVDDAGWSCRGCGEFVLFFESVQWPDCERRRLATHSLGGGLGVFRQVLFGRDPWRSVRFSSRRSTLAMKACYVLLVCHVNPLTAASS